MVQFVGRLSQLSPENKNGDQNIPALLMKITLNTQSYDRTQRKQNQNKLAHNHMTTM